MQRRHRNGIPVGLPAHTHCLADDPAVQDANQRIFHTCIQAALQPAAVVRAGGLAVVQDTSKPLAVTGVFSSHETEQVGYCRGFVGVGVICENDAKLLWAHVP